MDSKPVAEKEAGKAPLVQEFAGGVIRVSHEFVERVDVRMDRIPWDFTNPRHLCEEIIAEYKAVKEGANG